MNDSAFSRVTGALMAPVETFRKIAERPTWLLPLLLTMITGFALTAVVMPRLDIEQVVRTQLAESGANIPADQLESQVEISTKVGTVIAWVGPAIFPPLALAVLALVFWGSASMFGGKLAFRQSLGVVSHAWMPQVVLALLSIPVVLSRKVLDPAEAQGGHFLASHLGILVERVDGPVLFSVLSSIEVFSLWSLALIGIGLAAAAKLSRTSAALAVAIPWIVWVVGKAGLAALPALMKG